MATPYHAVIRAAGTVGMMFAATTAPAQVPHRVTRSPSALLTQYVEEHEHAARAGVAGMQISDILIHHTEYSQADVESLLQGLEQLALTSDLPRLRAEAAMALSTPASRHALTPPVPGVFARLQRVYRRSDDPLVRLAVVGAMSDQRDIQAAVPFLEAVASSQDSLDSAGLAGKALTSLILMGDEGRAALKRLHDSRAVHAPEPRQILETMTKNDYRIPERKRH